MNVPDPLSFATLLASNMPREEREAATSTEWQPPPGWRPAPPEEVGAERFVPLFSGQIGQLVALNACSVGSDAAIAAIGKPFGAIELALRQTGIEGKAATYVLMAIYSAIGGAARGLNALFTRASDHQLELLRGEIDELRAELVELRATKPTTTKGTTK
jgi:hypothetical protein